MNLASVILMTSDSSQTQSSRGDQPPALDVETQLRQEGWSEKLIEKMKSTQMTSQIFVQELEESN